ncbi:MAG: 4a-hydroxytetrahydrobiopterin dehydratase [Planctomycetota bacterium]
MAEPLTAEQIESALNDLPGWSYADDKLQKRFEFGSFKEAMSFLVRVGFEAEAMGHHPELFNVYSKVDIALNTHDAGGKVTELDVRLAKAIESFAWRD